jgi:hypothetical protein
MNDITLTVIRSSKFENWFAPDTPSKYRAVVEWVPIETVATMREYGPGGKAGLRWPDRLEALSADILESGFKSPLQLEYGTEDRKAYLGEGNHRLAAAELLGLECVPVLVQRRSSTEYHESVSKPVPGHDGYIPQQTNPASIGLPIISLDALDLDDSGISI